MSLLTTNRYVKPLLAIVLFAILYGTAGIGLAPNWDEKASMDIAQGIRPPFVVNDNGSLTSNLHYERVLNDSIFSSSDYAKLNTPGNVVNSVMNDNSNSLLYYLALHGIAKAGHANITAMRIFSIVTAALVLLLVFIIAQHLFPGNNGWPLFALLFTAINGQFLVVSFAIRAYMLATALLLWCFLVLIQMLREGELRMRRTIVFGLLSTAAIFTHYFSAAVIAGFLAVLIIHLLINRPVSAKRAAIHLFVLFFLLSPVILWLMFAKNHGLENLAMLNTGWNIRAGGTGWEFNLSNLVRQMRKAGSVFTGTASLPAGSSNMWNYAGLTVILGLIFVMIRGWRTLFTERTWPLIVVCITAIAVYVFASAWSGHFLVFERKYLVFQLPFFSLLFTAGLRAAADFKPWRTATYLLCVYMIVVGLSVFMITFNWILVRKPAAQPFGLASAERPVYITDQLLEFQRAGNHLSATLPQHSSITYDSWQHAHYLNYYLRSRPYIRQQVVTPAGTGLPFHRIVIRTGKTEWTIRVLQHE